MKILVASNGLIWATAHNFEFGAWEERDTTNGVITHKWKGEDADGNTLMYFIDENMSAIDGSEQPIFTVHKVTEIPKGAESGKYLYIDGAFVQNPDYVEPPKSDAERIAELENEVDDLTEYQAELLYEVSLIQLGLTEDDL